MKRIVVIGPESTGKSTLCAQLAAHYGTVWCPEFARDYLTQHGMQYTPNDLVAIAKGQQQLQAQTEKEARNGLCFIDTDQYVMKVWFEVVFGTCPTPILKTIARTSCDLYLLCNTDLPWVKEDLREYPDLRMRQRLFRTYFDAVLNSGTPWAVVSGTDQERLQSAINAVDELRRKNSAA